MEPNMLLISVLNARGLYLKGHSNMDALVTVTMHGKGSMRSRAVTEAIHTDGDCKWEEHMEFKIVDPSASLTICAQHKSRIGRNDIIGRVEMQLDEAKAISGDHWFPLRKKSGDDKYRGEVQLRFHFRYEKSGLSASNQSLNALVHKDTMLDKLKGKIKLGKLRHKSDPDGMSIASGVSGVSAMSSFSKISKGGTLSRLGFGKKKDKGMSQTHSFSNLNGNSSATLPPPSSMSVSLHTSQPDLLAPAFGGHSNPPVAFQRGGSRRWNGNPMQQQQQQVERQQMTSTPIHSKSASDEVDSRRSSSRLSHVVDHHHQPVSPITMAPVSPSVSTADSFHRPPSVASSGFGSNSANRPQNGFDDINRDDLLSKIDKLEMECRVKDSRLRDMEEYLDDLLSRVMERCPEVLANGGAQGGLMKTNRRFFSSLGF